METSPGVFEWQVVERYVYTPYGVATVHDPDWSNPAAPATDGPLYAGYHFDPETGLYHVRNRHYDPSLGAFTTRDPIGYAAGDANLYRYVGNDPVGAVDPSGLDWRSANASIAMAEQQLEYVRRLMENSASLRSEIEAAAKKYEQLNVAANRELNNYLGNSWGGWYYGPELSERAYRLPVSVSDSTSQSPYLNQLMYETRGQRRSLEDIAENLTVAEHAIRTGMKTAAVGVIVIATAGTASVFVAPVVVSVVGGGLLSVAYGTQVQGRVDSGQDWGQALWGGINDIAGVTNITMGGWGYDPGTGQLHDLSAEQRGDLLGCGIAQVTLWATGPAVFKAGQNSARLAYPQGLSLRLPTLTSRFDMGGGGMFSIGSNGTAALSPASALTLGWTSVTIPLASQGSAAAGGLLSPPVCTLMSGSSPRSGAGKSDPHGRAPGQAIKNQLAEAESKLQELIRNQGSKADKTRLRNLIKNLNKQIEKMEKGETHWRRGT
ncbi:MAG: RHS repeat-associated core domain-containing protein [Patescibacteria group bacterium]|nr:RHS repeat-associated core domain-containing protein [Patescibacteria group bacterium]